MKKRKLRKWVKILGAALLGTGLRCCVNNQKVKTVTPPSKAAEYEIEEEEDAKTLSEWKLIDDSITYVLTFCEDGTVRSIPVKETGDVSYAMTHNVYGEVDSMGSVFCDPYAVMPKNLVIYGHSSKTKDWCFTFLKRYREEEYFENNDSFSLESDTGFSTYQIVSLAEYEIDDKLTFLDWADSEADVEKMFKESVPYLLNKKNGIMYNGESVITLVTCNMEKENARYVLQALSESA